MPRRPSSHLRVVPTEPERISHVHARVEVSDADLVERALTGDRWAQEAIFRRYVGDVTRIADRLLNQSLDADDVAQDTFATAFTAMHTLRDPSQLRSWLLGIAVRRVRRRHRRLKIMRALGLDRTVDHGTLAAEAAVQLSPEQHAELTMVNRALAHVAADDRIAWLLRHVEGEKLAKMASITGCSLATVKHRIAAADSVIQTYLGRGGAP